MKKIFIGFLIGVMLTGVTSVYALTRNDVYRMFGPKLLEAIVLVIKDEINVLRLELSLPERTNQQFLTALDAKINSLSNYDWMK